MEKPKRYHRFRFYPNVWSTFDTIEPCKTRGCLGCMYKHPVCDEDGRIIEPEKN